MQAGPVGEAIFLFYEVASPRLSSMGLAMTFSIVIQNQIITERMLATIKTEKPITMFLLIFDSPKIKV